jgi:hypothetical protein
VETDIHQTASVPIAAASNVCGCQGNGPVVTGYSFIICSKPPQNIRLPSNGICILAISVSSLIFLLAASRVALSGYSIQLKIGVSSSFAWVAL